MKIKSFIKNNIIGLIIGIVGIIYGLYTIINTNAATIRATDINYNSTVTTYSNTASQALTRFYSRYNLVRLTPYICYENSCGELKFKYWNAGFNGTNYSSSNIPTSYYAGPELLKINYDATAATGSKFDDRPFYIRTTVINNVNKYHSVCLKYNGKEFCMEPGYWIGELNVTSTDAANATKLYLKRNMETAFGESTSSCNTGSWIAECYMGGTYYCNASNSGQVTCGILNHSCLVDNSGIASCQ